MKEVVFADEKVEIQELTRRKLKDFINKEWGPNLESSLRWKGGIETLQEKLGINPDGDFGPATLKALLDFQLKNNLDKDGLVGKETIDALNGNLKGGKITSIDSKKNGNKTQNKENNEKLPRDVISVFNKTEKGRVFLDYVKKYSELNIEKLSALVLKTSKAFNIPQNRIVSVIIGEADIANKSNPFKANMSEKSRLAKGVGQFLPETFKDLYSKTIWEKGVAVEGNVLQYFEAKGEKKYSENLKNIGINNQNDRYNPEKSIMAIGAYLRYIMMIGKGVNGDVSMAVARYNVGPNGSIANHLENNPAVALVYKKKYGNEKPTEKKVALAAKAYYSQFA
ncbi:MAG: peptidoglycan-binding protein [Candidatus Gracilibacteria bacterium]|nr:peptidoglycan-binding protein [Candidatus Gracilibacteria bacterium]